LDAGCGIGLNSLYLAKKRPSAIIDACDVTPGLVQAASIMRDDIMLNNLNVFQADLTRLSDVNKYDLILCMDVIEHIPDDSKVLANFSQALKDGGILFMSTNHKRHIKRRLKRLKYKGGAGHVRDGYTESELGELLQNNGFEVKEVRSVWGFWGEYCEELYLWTILHFPAPVAALSFPVLSMFSSLDMLSKNSHGYGIMVIAQKKSAKNIEVS
jgi:SAM-dependent methyltransferase